MTKTMAQIRREVAALRILGNADFIMRWWNDLNSEERLLYWEVEKERSRPVEEACKEYEEGLDK